MSSKLINRSVDKYLLSVAILTLIMPSLAFAGTSSGSFSLSLQVVPKCNIPSASNTGLSQSQDITKHLTIKCSAQAKPAEVKILAAPTANQVFEHQNESVNILVSY